MFKKVVSLCLSAAAAFSVSMTAGAEDLKDRGNFTGSEECWQLCKTVKEYVDVCKNNTGKALYHVFENRSNPTVLLYPNDGGLGELIHNLTQTSVSLAIVYTLRCLGVPCPGLFKIGTDQEILDREFAGRDLSEFGKLPYDNRCKEGGEVLNFLDWQMADMEKGAEEGKLAYEGYIDDKKR